MVSRKADYLNPVAFFMAPLIVAVIGSKINVVGHGIMEAEGGLVLSIENFPHLLHSIDLMFWAPRGLQCLKSHVIANQHIAHTLEGKQIHALVFG